LVSYLIFFTLTVVTVLVVFKIILVGSIVGAFPVTQGAMFHPTARIRLKTALDYVPMAKGDLLVDIGCGDGRVLLAAARRYGACAIGYEINPLAYILARMRTWGKKEIQVKYANFWREHLGRADVVFCYLFPDVMGKLAEKFSRELRPGTRIISCNFPLPHWQAVKVLYPPSSLYGDPIYIYQVSPPAGTKASGM